MAATCPSDAASDRSDATTIHPEKDAGKTSGEIDPEKDAGKTQDPDVTPDKMDDQKMDAPKNTVRLTVDDKGPHAGVVSSRVWRERQCLCSTSDNIRYVDYYDVRCCSACPTSHKFLLL